MALLDRVLDGAGTKAGQIAVIVCGAVVFLGVLFPPLDSPRGGLAGVTRRELSVPIWSGDLHDKHYPRLPAKSGGVLAQLAMGRDYSKKPERVDYFDGVNWRRLVVEGILLAVLFAVSLSVAGVAVSPVDVGKRASGDRDQGSS